MYNAFLQRTKETIAALGKHILTSDRFRVAVFDQKLKCASGTSCFDPALASTELAPDKLEWRIIDHCAAVTRLYAIYEQFVHEMIREHLGLLQGHLSFTNLPASIQLAYRLGLSKILEKKDGPRFGDLDLATLIKGYNAALGGEDYNLEPRAILLLQEQNLRLPELGRFMAQCGVAGMEAWVEQHRAVREFFATDDRLTASAASQMAELVKYRNDAAHGSIDIGAILHVNVLIEFCEFISAVCESLAERIQLAGLCTLEENKSATERGKITELLKGGMVAIGVMTGSFRVGDSVYLCGDSYCFERKIVSLQLEGVPQEDVNLAVESELGIGLDGIGKKNAIIMTREVDNKNTDIDVSHDISTDLDQNTGANMNGVAGLAAS
jgi:hypothetical protein